MDHQKNNIWNRSLNLIFVYIIIFLFGVVIVGIMTNILDKKVQEYNKETFENISKNM